MVAHFVAVLFTGFIIYTASPGSSLFSWHPTLMAISFCFLMFEAILIFSPHSSLISLKSRSTKVTWHWVTLLVAFISAVGGIIIIYYNKALNNKSHFTSWHGLIGIITMVYFMLQLCGGLFVRYPKLIPSIRLIDLRLYHATSGLVAFLLVCFTLFLSMYSNWFCKNITGTSWYACVGCIGLMTTMITNQVTSAYIPRLQKRLQQKISAPI
ncbi:cytochrome b561 domain-containing protein 2-like [Argonauta hians]